MANLLPTDQKESIFTEYKMRLAAGGMGILVVVLLAGIALLIPSFILTETRYQQNQAMLDSISDSDASTSTQENRSVINTTNKKLDLVNKDTTRVLPTDVLELLAETQSGGVRVNRISIAGEQNQDLVEGEQIAVSLSGVADTRNNLLRFEDSLSNRAQVSAVDLPIETLASSENTPFDMTVVIQPL